MLILFDAGVSLNLTNSVSMLDVSVSLPGSFKGGEFQTRGLMGSFNGEVKDDFMLENRTVLSPNLTDEQIFHQFGEQCKFCLFVLFCDRLFLCLFVFVCFYLRVYFLFALCLPICLFVFVCLFLFKILFFICSLLTYLFVCFYLRVYFLFALS